MSQLPLPIKLDPKQTVVERLDMLPTLPPGELLCVDVETVSYNDYEYGTAFDGKSRVCGYSITDEALNSWYIPVAHRSGIEGENLPLKEAQEWLQHTLGDGRDIVNHNIKFDARFWRLDGVQVKGRLLDTMVLARLIECDRFAYTLDSLARDYLGAKKTTSTVKGYLKTLKKKGDNNKEPKDYGLVPVSILGPYAMVDSTLTMRLYKMFMSKMAEGKLHHASLGVWETEAKLTKKLMEAEVSGVPINVKAIKETWKYLLREMLEITQGLNEVAEPILGREFDPGSEDDLTELFAGHFKCPIKAYTEKSNKPQWNGMALRTLAHPDANVKKMGEAVATYAAHSSFAGSFCAGWLKRTGIDQRLHCDFRIAGTATGRLSCADPNMQNVPPRAENFVEVAPGRVIIGFDYSQIEYRIFGHYTGDERIVGEYANNPNADFHQFLADILGVDRQFAKQLNFSFLYGMGKNKLLTNLAGILSLKADESDEMREKMRLMAYGAGTSISQRAKQLTTTEETRLMAANIYAKYHEYFPSIKALQKRIASAIKVRGWIRNYFGRVYVIKPEWIHVGVNYLIQGTAADLFKNRLLAVFEELEPHFDFTMVTNVHDSGYFDVRREHGPDFYKECRRILEQNPGFRLPLKVEGKVSTKTWGTVEKVKSDEDYVAAVERSETALTRLAGLARHEWDDPSKKTKGRYEFAAATEEKDNGPKTLNPQDRIAIKVELSRGRVTALALAKRYGVDVSEINACMK